jgi:uncharacterized membrane protein YdjX (TVP38/TMEM64 family)
VTARALTPARLALGVALVLLMAGGLVAARLWPDAILAATEAALLRLRGMGMLGWLVLGAVQMAVAVFGVLPASLIGVAAGVVYGTWLGFAISAASTMAGAAAAFAISRSAFRPLVANLMRRRASLLALDDALAREGWRFVCLVRISPVMPFAPTSYVLGLSAVSWRDYLGGTLASLPALFGYVFLGAIADEGLLAWQRGAGPLRWTMLGVGLLAVGVLTWRLGAILRRIYRAGARA